MLFYTIRFAPLLRASLALPVALTLAACPFPNDIGDSPLDSDTDATTGAGGSTTTGPSLTTSETGDATDATTAATETTTSPETTFTTETTTLPGTATLPDEPTTSTVTGDLTSATDTSTTDTSTTDPPNPDGMCFDENHGDYWCECTESETMACRDDGVRVCLTVSFVVTEHKFSPCGVCGPGDALACDVRGEPGKQFCNLDSQDLWIEDFDMPPTAAWGVCVLEGDIACQPGALEQCDGGFTECLVDEQGIPFTGPCI
jgi:hypothetical protein